MWYKKRGIFGIHPYSDTGLAKPLTRKVHERVTKAQLLALYDFRLTK